MHFNEIFKVLSNILSSYFLGLFFVLRILMLQRHSKTIYNLLNSAIPVFFKNVVYLSCYGNKASLNCPPEWYKCMYHYCGLPFPALFEVLIYIFK